MVAFTGFVLCEHVLVGEKLYPVYFSVGTMLLAFYVCERYDEELCLEIVHGLEKRLLEDLLL